MPADGQPLVSVIMPCYNAEAYLDEAITSVAAQTVADWELMILDDGSTDGSREIAARWAASDPRIRLLENPENLGAARTRNRGLDLASGTWIALLDSDDIWRPEKLQLQLSLAERSGAELIYSSYSLFREDRPGRSAYLVPPKVDYKGLLKENVIGCSTVLLRRDALGDKRFPLDVYHEDYALWLELLRSGVRAAGCTEILADWRISPDSRSHDKRDAAKNRWIIYRRAEKLPLPKALRCFASYAVRGVSKHKRV